jgi:hypothetical protein
VDQGGIKKTLLVQLNVQYVQLENFALPPAALEQHVQVENMPLRDRKI